MLANWVRQTTSTTGTGAIALDGTPPAGCIAFSDVFHDGESVFYVIEDGNAREVGQGTLSAGTPWTLSRDFVFETLDGSGVYARSSNFASLTPLNLSGNAVVGIDTAAQQLFSPARIPIDGSKAIAPANVGTNQSYGTKEAFGADVFVCFPAYYTAFTDTTKAVLNVTVGGGTKARIGIYAYNPNSSRPGKLLAETGDITSGTAAYYAATLTPTFKLKPGWYWVGYASDGNPEVRTFNVVLGNALESRGAYGACTYKGGLATGWTSLPADGASFTSWGQYSATKEVPAIWLRT